MTENLAILRALLAETEAGRPVALCVVLKTCGSTPQCPGAAMLVRADFGTLGTLGGGCIEAEVRRRAFELLRAETSALLEFDLDHDYGWDDGLVCGGRMSIGVSVLGPGSDVSPYRRAVAGAARREPAWFPLNVLHEGAPVTYRVHLEVPPVLLVAGAGHVGQAVAKLAVELGFHVVVVDDRADMASPERFAPPIERRMGDISSTLEEYPVDENTFVVIVTRGHQHDRQALEAVVRRPARYIGMIGSRRKAATILDGLRAAGVPAEPLDRVRSPIGLPIGSITVPEIAVSIMAEVVQQRRQQTPRLVSMPEASNRT